MTKPPSVTLRLPRVGGDRPEEADGLGIEAKVTPRGRG